MKKELIFLCLLALLSAGLFAQESIAVFPFEDLDKVFSRNESVMFYREFSNEFTNKNAGRLKIVPRQEVEKLINTEVAFQLSDFSAKAKTAEMQKVLNGTQILSGVIGKVGSRISVSVSLYNYPELQQLPGGTSLRVANIDELFDKIPELVNNMQKAITENKSSASPPPEPKKIYKIGDRGPGGGIIFSISYGSYYECSSELGKAVDKNRARDIATSHRGGGFNDWRLPNQSELDEMYTNLKINNLGGFVNDWYFSSQYSANFRNGERETKSRVENGLARTNCRVRAVRSFRS